MMPFLRTYLGDVICYIPAHTRHFLHTTSSPVPRARGTLAQALAHLPGGRGGSPGALCTLGVLQDRALRLKPVSRCAHRDGGAEDTFVAPEPRSHARPGGGEGGCSVRCLPPRSFSVTPQRMPQSKIPRATMHGLSVFLVPEEFPSRRALARAGVVVASTRAQRERQCISNSKNDRSQSLEHTETQAKPAQCRASINQSYMQPRGGVVSEVPARLTRHCSQETLLPREH